MEFLDIFLPIDADRIQSVDDMLYIGILYDLIEVLDKKLILENLRLLRMQSNELDKYQDRILDLLADNRRNYNDVIKMPDIDIIENVHEMYTFYINKVKDFFSGILDGLDFLTTEEMMARNNADMTTRVLLSCIPNLRDIKIKRALKPKIRLVRKEYSSSILEDMMKNVIEKIDEAVILADQVESLCSVMEKYKDQMSRNYKRFELRYADLTIKDKKFPEYVDTDKKKDIMLARLEKERKYLKLEANFIPKSNQALIYINRGIEEEYKIYQKFIEEFIKCIGG